MPKKPRKTKNKRNQHFQDYVLDFFRTGNNRFLQTDDDALFWESAAFFSFKDSQESAWRDLIQSGVDAKDFPHGVKLFGTGG